MASNDLDQRAVNEAFESIKKVFSQDQRNDFVTNLPQLVLFSEKAIECDSSSIAIQCIELYFSLNPPTNQFLIRAHLCLALAHKAQTLSEAHKLQECFRHLVKAINIAKKLSCYHFLVYNASVIFWRVTRPFHVPQYYHLCGHTLQQVVKSLEETKCRDYSWRLQLMRLLVKCQLQNNQKEDATKTGSSAIHLARKHDPNQLVPIYKQLVNDGIGDVKLIEKEVKSDPQLSVLSKIWKLKSAMGKRPSLQNETESKLVKLLASVTNGGGDTTTRPNGRSSSPHIKPLPPESLPLVLIEMAELAMNYSLPIVATSCLTHLNSVEGLDLGLTVRRRLLETQLQVTTESEQYTKRSIKLRCQCVEKCQDLLTTCIREDLDSEIELVCVVLWNLSLPLLQPSLSQHIIKPFSLAATALEYTNSLMYGLRAALHFELAKTLGNQDKSSSAHKHYEKAIYLDHQHINSDHYRLCRLQLKLKARIYSEPRDPLDEATAVIEQLKAPGNDSCTDGLHQLLLSVGELLDPGYFSKVLTYQLAIDPDTITEQDLALHDLSNKALQYKAYKERVQSHYETVGHKENDVRRCLLWADVAKLARKHGLWDIGVLSSLYCIHYDNGEWHYTPATGTSKEMSTLKVVDSKTTKRGSTGSSSSLATPDHTSSSSSSVSLTLPYTTLGISNEKRLLITLAEVHCVYAECLVHKLQSEGVQLGGVVKASNADDQENQLWKNYSEWIVTLSSDAHESFLRCAELGSALCEHWLIANAVVYIWNYHHDNMKRKQWSVLTEQFRSLFHSLKAEPAAMREGPLVCSVAGVFAGGLVQSWLPQVDTSSTVADSLQKKGTGSRTSAKSKKKGDVAVGQVSPEAGPALKEAVEVCEFAMECFLGMPLNTRKVVYEQWVTAKQLLQQPVNIKALPHELGDDQLLSQCRAVVGAEMHREMNTFRLYDFPACPTILEVQELINGCDWRGCTTIQLELYTVLTHSAYLQQDHQGVSSCCERALQLSSSVKDTNGYRLLSVAVGLLGQSLVSQADGNTATIKRAIGSFEKSVHFGGEAGSYGDVIQSCRHAWNAIALLLATPSDRATLKSSLTNILNNVMKLIGRKAKVISPPPSEQDCHMLSDMISTVLQVYKDEGDWEVGLETLDNLLGVAPKALQRELYKQKIMFKSELGRNIEGEMLRFQEEPHHVIASLWFTAARHSSNKEHQSSAYQNAIQALQQSREESSQSTLVECIVEYSQWLHANQYPADIVIEHFQWAEHELTKDHTQFDAAQLDMLLMLHVMMVVVSEEQKEHQCLQSVAYCLKIWKGLLDDGRGKMPESLSEWISFSLSSEVIDLVSSQKSLVAGDPSINHSIPSYHTLKKPRLSLYYTDRLFEGLCSHGHHLLSLPVLFYQLLISKAIICDELTTQLTLLRLSDVLGQLDRDDPSLSNDYFNQAAGNEFLHPHLIIRAESDKIAGSHVTTNGDHVISDKGCVQDVWLQIAELLMKQGQFQSARELLQQALQFSETYKDRTSLIKTQLLMAKLASFECNSSHVIETLIKIKDSVSDSIDWITLVDILLYNTTTTAVMDSSSYRDDTVRDILTTILLDNNKSQGNSHDQKYLKAVIQGRLLAVSDTISAELEESVLETVNYLRSVGQHRLCRDTLSYLINMRLKSSSDEDLLKAVQYSREAVNILLSASYHLPTPTNSSQFLLPIQRDMVKAQLTLCEALMAVLKRAVSRKRLISNSQQQKSSIEKMIQNYTEEEGAQTLSGIEQQLKDIEEVAVDESLTILSNAFYLCGKDSRLRTECLLYIGLFLHLLSVDKSPDPPLQRTLTPSLEGEDKIYSTLSMVMRAQQATQDQSMECASLEILTHSTNVLMECVSLALTNRQLDIVKKASFELVDVFGCCDPLMATSFLALYQSCVVSRRCRELLNRVLKDPSNSRLSALLNQEAFLWSHDQHMTTTADANLKLLEKDYEAYRRLQVNLKHVELMNQLHCDTRLIILQHSEDRSTLFAGYLIPPQPPPVVKKGQPLPDRDPLVPVVCSAEVSPEDMASLKRLVNQYKEDIKASLQRQMDRNEDMVQTAFECVSTGLEAYLEGINAVLMDALRKEDPSKGLTVVLLADQDLMEFPLESLQFLQCSKNIVSVSRNLSLQMLVNQIINMRNSVDAGVEDADGKKKADKYQPQPESLVANTASFKYILDPRDDLKSVDGVKKVIQTFGKVTGKWTGLSGAGHVISSGEWNELITSSSGLIVVCSENMLSHCTTTALASANLPDTGIVIIQDKMSSALSYRTQSKLDIATSMEDQLLEGYMVAVIILLVTGVNCVIINQWYSSIEEGVAQMD